MNNHFLYHILQGLLLQVLISLTWILVKVLLNIDYDNIGVVL